MLHPPVVGPGNISRGAELTIIKKKSLVRVKEAIPISLGLHLWAFLGVQKVSTFVIKDWEYFSFLIFIKCEYFPL